MSGEISYQQFLNEVRNPAKLEGLKKGSGVFFY